MASVQLDIYGIGHALVDLQYKIQTENLLKLGIKKGVMSLVDSKQQSALIDQIDSQPIASSSGGSAANTMIGVTMFGGKTFYSCLTGQDEMGSFYQEDLRKAGVLTSESHRVRGATGRCVVLITPDADRTLLTSLGVSEDISPNQIDERRITESKYVYIEGYLLSSENGFETCLQAQKLGKKYKKKISITLSDPFMVSTFSDRFSCIINNGIDLLFCNEQEAMSLTNESNGEKAASALGKVAHTSYVTCGADGAFLVRDKRLNKIDAVSVEAIDTNGAGDIFAGGVLYGLTHSFDENQSGYLGCHAAAQIVKQYGARLERPLNDAAQIIADKN